MDIRRLPPSLARREFSLPSGRGHLVVLESGMIELLNSQRSFDGRQALWVAWDKDEVLRLEAGTRAVLVSLTRVEMAAVDGTVLSVLSGHNLSAVLPVVKWQRFSMLCDLIEEELLEPRFDSHLRSVSAAGLLLTSFLRLVRPNASQGVAQLPLAERFMLLAAQHLHDHWSVNDYAQALGVTRFQLGDAVQRHFGHKPQAYLQNQWLEQAQALLRQPQLRVAAVAYRLGFQEPAYFSRAFKQLTGQTPREWREALYSRSERNFAAWP